MDADACAIAAEFGDHAFDAAQVLGSGVVVEADAVADVQHRERLCGVDGFEQVDPGTDGVSDRVQVGVQGAGGDLVEQQLFGVGCGRRPVGRRGLRLRAEG